MIAKMNAIAQRDLRRNVYGLKLVVMEINSAAKRLERSAGLDKKKCKRSIKMGHSEKARTHAENAIRNLNLSNSYKQTSSRVNVVIYCVENAIKSNKIQKNMSGIVKSMRSALKNRELPRALHIMDIFEREMENLGVKFSVLEDAMAKTSASAMPQLEVDSLIQQLSEENRLDMNARLPPVLVMADGWKNRTDEVDKRFSNLRK